MGTGTDVAMHSAGVTLVKGDLRGIVQAIALSRATMRNIRQNLWFAFLYNGLGVPIAAGVLYPFFGLLLSPIFASAAMALSSVSVIGNALRLKKSSAMNVIATALPRLRWSAEVRGISPSRSVRWPRSWSRGVSCSKAPEPERKVKMYQSPMHPWITSEKPGNCTICGMALVPVYEGESGMRWIQALSL